MLVILVTWEAEIGGLQFKARPANSLQDSVQKIAEQSGLEVWFKQ
jgi:hypothetical protein